MHDQPQRPSGPARSLQAALPERERQLQFVSDHAAVLIAQCDVEGRYKFVNRPYAARFGLEPRDVVGKHIAEVVGEEAFDTFRKHVEEVSQGKPVQFELEIPYRTGGKQLMRCAYTPEWDSHGHVVGLVAAIIDISDRKWAEALQAGQRGVLEMIAKGAPLREVLEAVCRLIEEQEPGLLCSILLTDDGGRHTGVGFGPSLPSDFVQALQGIDISLPHVGSCCRALDCGEEVLVADVEHDDRWSRVWRDLNLAYGLRACRSIPIRGSDGTVLASVAVFRRHAGDPGPANKELLGIATHLAGIAIDRRRREARERELLVREAAANTKFRAFFDQGPLFSGIMHVDGTMVEPNRLCLDACGYSREQVVGKLFWDCPWWSPAPALAQLIQAASKQAAAGETYRAEMPYYVADGEVRMVDLIITPIKDEAGQVLFLAPIGTDITDRKRAEAKLRTSEVRMRLLWEAAAVLLTTNDPETMLGQLFDKISPHLQLDTYFNFMVNESGSGLKLASCAGISADDARRIETLELGEAICGTVALSRNPLTVNFIQQSSDPRAQLAKSLGVRCYACNPLQSGDALLGTLSFASRSRDAFDAEELDFLQTICHYVTAAYERLRLIRRLQDADRRKDEFLATLAHELRNPLAPLRNGLQVLRLAGAAGDLANEARTMMERQLSQMVHLIDDLLDLSRISRGKIDLRKERAELAKIVQHAVETSQPALEQAGHDFQIDMPDVALYVDADVTRLAQVFSNLLNNAAKYTERGGRVRLTVRQEQDDVVISVRDTGMGIPPAMLPRVFEMFTQVDRNLERAQGGLGIGLSIVRRLVEMHGGNVEAHSAGHGLGSEFVVRLPLVRCGPLLPPAMAASTPARRRRVLVVDDNRDAAVSLAMMLRLIGNEAQTAHDGLEALDTASVFRPELILLDIGMPRLNGYDTARQIRRQPWAQGVSLVALTGWGQEEDRRKSHEAGFDAHLTKPIEPAALEKLLTDLPVTVV